MTVLAYRRLMHRQTGHCLAVMARAVAPRRSLSVSEVRAHGPIDELRGVLERDRERMPEIAARARPRTAHEPWREKLWYVQARLRATADHRDDGYVDADEYALDLQLLDRTLRGAGFAAIADHELPTGGAHRCPTTSAGTGKSSRAPPGDRFSRRESGGRARAARSPPSRGKPRTDELGGALASSGGRGARASGRRLSGRVAPPGRRQGWLTSDPDHGDAAGPWRAREETG